ncbi:MAG: hypothetical protein JWO80_4202 [Bryobacterales bacterium]|nr:hypothetical protein [Bryobacterales bacterium]
MEWHSEMSFALDSAGYYRPPQFSDILWLSGGFGTRGSSPAAGELATVHQIHSAGVIQVDRAGLAGDGDALITNSPGVVLGVKTADCVPLLMADIHHRAVAAVHAGWRGAALGIAPAVIAAMKEAFGTLPEDLRVAIGPAIGPCCFEVGPEVAREFEAYEQHATKNDGLPYKVYLDLAGINREQLERAGVPGDQIEESGLCTFCSPGEFFSFRRDREEAGRMFSVIGILK